MESIRFRGVAVCRRFATFTSAASSLGQSHRRGLYVIVALLAATITVAAAVKTFDRPASTTAAGAQNRLAIPEATRTVDADRPHESRPSGDGRLAARPSMADRTPSPVTGSTALGMIGTGVLAALLGGFAVRLRWRRRHPGAADDPAAIRARRISHAAAVGAAFCLGLAVALAAVLLTESRMVRPVPALATVQGESADHWRREALTLSERLRVLDARLATLESTRTGDGQARQQPTSTATIGPTVSEYAVAGSESPATMPTADVLRSPRVVEVQGSVGDRVWNDIMNDWERVRRTVRAWLPGGSR